MASYLALFRAVNVGGTGAVSMPALRALVTDLGFEDARSWLQTGNIVFRGRSTPGPALERRLELECARRLGLRTTVMVRTADEWREALAANPFPSEAERDPSHLLVGALKEAPVPEAWKRLAAAARGPEYAAGRGRQAYLVYPAGIGRSKLTLALVERCLGTSATCRNWNTSRKLLELAETSGGA